jgi:hypothetical protein
MLRSFVRSLFAAVATIALGCASAPDDTASRGDGVQRLAPQATGLGRHAVRASRPGCEDIGSAGGTWRGAPIFEGSDLFCTYRLEAMKVLGRRDEQSPLDALAAAALGSGADSPVIDRRPYVQPDRRPGGARPAKARLRRRPITIGGGFTTGTARPVAGPGTIGAQTTPAPTPKSGPVITNQGDPLARVNGCDACLAYVASRGEILVFVPPWEIDGGLWLNVDGQIYEIEGVTDQAFYVDAPSGVTEESLLLVHWAEPG